MKRAEIRGEDSDLVKNLKGRGAVAVRIIESKTLSEDLCSVAIACATGEYENIRIVPAELVLAEDYSFANEATHVVYANLKRGRPIPIVNAYMKTPSGIEFRQL